MSLRYACCTGLTSRTGKNFAMALGRIAMSLRDIAGAIMQGTVPSQVDEVSTYGSQNLVGWVERSETHQFSKMTMMGFARALNPSYACFEDLRRPRMSPRS